MSRSRRTTPAPSESDVNSSPRRTQWQHEHLDEATRALLARDSAAFLHQSVSTPCLDAIAKAEGIWIEDLAGRRYMDFHGNNVHHVGYAHPDVLAAIKAQLDALSFAPRRFASDRAVELAEALGAKFRHSPATPPSCCSPRAAPMRSKWRQARARRDRSIQDPELLGFVSWRGPGCVERRWRGVVSQRPHRATTPRQ
jgi:hypothetical protein